LVGELRCTGPLFGYDLPMTDKVRDVLDNGRLVAQLPSVSFEVHLISMATASADVLIVDLLQRDCKVPSPLRSKLLFYKLTNMDSDSACLTRLFLKE